ncbi:PASTA domain-containing penicillin-binding protein [Alicyclobacillus sp.]|uniref:PASTA domain-containing penicillin-binding protein n=1 Tax=Alicyclobacillus sp. TaxID=61169 RepID=UPI0025BC558A|nr:PASTA domain-containing penicillin-binding protein [Alicyclobacillus sp.]MCL6515372.1 PASTA domain-containing protein [Alicyclobacillus sp.]
MPARNPESPRGSRRHRRRVIWMQALSVLAVSGVAIRILYVQGAFGPRLLANAAEVQRATQTVIAQRGELLDRNGHRLAYDVPAFYLDIRTGAFTDLSQLAGQLAPILGEPQDQVQKILGRSNRWVRWPKPVLQTVRDQIQQTFGTSHPQDFTFTPTQERFYPYGDFASNTLGFVNHDGVGTAGLEAQYNDVLSGENGEITYEKDNWGFPLQTTIEETKAPKPGQNVELTLDQTIQGFVESKMNELVDKYHPEHAAIVVTDPNTGEILGISSRPSYNPNDYASADPRALSDNWAVNDAFEPGSTFKAITLTAGLATHTITLDDTFTSGHITVAGHRIGDWNGKGWGTITFRQALEYSSNVGFATVALKLGWDNLLHYMQAFGFLNKTGVDLPAEAGSIIFPPSSRHQVQLATSGFGQGIAVTPMQQIAAYGAIANGGRLLQPHLAKAIVDPDTGQVVKTFQPKVLNPQVAPPDVLRQVSDTLVLDITEGIDGTGRIPGYDVAGKTGTANVADPKTGKYYSDRLIVSFIGYAPASHPRFEVFVTLYWPKTSLDNTWGSTIATPAARDLLQECLEYAHVPPDHPEQVKATATTAQAQRYVETPNLSGQSRKAAEQALAKAGLTGQFFGNGQTVVRQWPQAGIEVPAGDKVYVNLGGGPGGQALMPDLTGASMRDAGNILAALGAELVPKGYGYAVSQSIPPGSPVPAGAKVTVTFQPPPDPIAAAAAAANAASGSTANSAASGSTAKGPGGTASGTGASSGGPTSP